MVELNKTTVGDNSENGAHNMVKLTIDNCEVVVPEHTTILDAAKSAGIQIPTLCYLRDLNEIGGCRVCLVEVEGCDQLVAACNNYVLDGMMVHTNSPKAREARRTNVQLLLSQHDSQCTSCVRSGNCNLQTIANDLGIFYLPYEQHLAREGWDFDFPIIRDNDKCIKCMRCIKVCESVQGLGIWDLTNRATHTAVGTRGRAPIGKTDCVACGQCVTHCPTGALRERDDTEAVFDALADPDKIVLVQIAPAVRSAWGEELGIPREEATVERLACALRRVGFEYVFDTDFSADLTIMEEGSELIERLGAAAKGEGDSRGWPMFTSCCPGWVRFVKARYPEFVDSLSTSKSPQQMFGAIAKTYYAKVLGVEPERLFVVSVMPCTAKKAECALPSMVGEDGAPDVDVARDGTHDPRKPRERRHAGRGAARYAAGLWHGRGCDLWRHGRRDGGRRALGILPGDGQEPRRRILYRHARTRRLEGSRGRYRWHQGARRRGTRAGQRRPSARRDSRRSREL